jgi:hypothetical protein
MTNTVTVNPPPYVTSLHELFWGVILVAISLTMHGFGMLYTLRFTGAFKLRFEKVPSFVTGMVHLILAAWMITLVHIFEVIMWAGFFQWKHCFVNFSTAAYFALNEYTTVGSPLDLPQNWHLLEGMIATAGLIGFAWSTGVLLTLAQEFQDQQLVLLKRRREKHQSTPSAAPGVPPGGEKP